MNATLPGIPAGYRPVRPLSERAGSWVQLAINPAGGWCALKLQQVAHSESLDELTATRGQLQRLSAGEGLMPLLAWGVEAEARVLWEELPLADNLLAEGRFVPEQSDTYTPLSLVAWLSEHGPASTAQVIEWGSRLAEAVARLHEAGLFHRDVKPANILFLRGLPVLADYGSVGCAGSSIEFPGTEGYVPPDGLGSPALDVFALGRTLYELWTGRDRFHFPSLPPAVTRRADWDTHGWRLNEILLHAADGRPSHRYGTASQLHAALAEAAQGRRRISRRAFLGAAGVGAGVVGAAYVWKHLPSHRAVWRRLSSGGFGYEDWAGHELSCDWAQRKVHSLKFSPRVGLSWQSHDLRTWAHEARSRAQGPEVYQHLVHPETGDLWGVSIRSGQISRVSLDGAEVTPLSVAPLDDVRFCGPSYWNPLTHRLGVFNGYGNFGVELTRREFDPNRGTWEVIAAAGPQPWPRGTGLLFPGRERKTWFLFGGHGNPSGRQGEKVKGLSGYDGNFYPLDDLWELDLATKHWRPLLPVQRWRPANLKSAIHHPGLDAVLFLTGSQAGRPQPAGLHLWAGEPGVPPRLLPSSGESIQLFRSWTLLVEPDTQDLIIFGDEGVFAVTLRPA